MSKYLIRFLLFVLPFSAVDFPEEPAVNRTRRSAAISRALLRKILPQALGGIEGSSEFGGLGFLLTLLNPPTPADEAEKSKEEERKRRELIETLLLQLLIQKLGKADRGD